MELSRLGVSGITTHNWTLAEDVAGYARHGIPFIGVWLFKCSDVSAEDVRRLIAQYGLSVSNVCFGGLFTGDSESERNSAIESTKRAIEFARDIGAGTVLLVSGPAGTHSLSDAIHHVRDGLLRVTEYAEEHGVDLALEPLHPHELTTFSVVNKLSTAVEMVEAIGSPRLGLFLDTYNLGWDPDVLDLIPKCGDMVKGVHLADWRNPARTFTDRELPGRGTLPIMEMVKVIEEAGYTGPYELEIFSDELWQSDYDRVIEDFKHWWLQLDGEVRRSE